MTFVAVMVELKAKFSDAELSPVTRRGTSFERASRVAYKRDKGGMYAGRDGDGTEVLVCYKDTTNRVCCTETVSDLGPDEE